MTSPVFFVRFDVWQFQGPCSCMISPVLLVVHVRALLCQDELVTPQSLNKHQTTEVQSLHPQDVFLGLQARCHACNVHILVKTLHACIFSSHSWLHDCVYEVSGHSPSTLMLNSGVWPFCWHYIWCLHPCEPRCQLVCSAVWDPACRLCLV